VQRHTLLNDTLRIAIKSIDRKYVRRSETSSQHGEVPWMLGYSVWRDQQARQYRLDNVSICIGVAVATQKMP